MATTKVTIRRKNYPRQIRSYGAFIVLILVAAGVYGFMQFQKLTTAQTALANAAQTAQTLRGAAETSSQNYQELKTSFDQNSAAIRNAIEFVFPSDENYTKLTQSLDKEIDTLNSSSLNPIFASDLKFAKPKLNTATDYVVLPFTLTLNTTRDNYDKFMRYVENSGDLDEQTRLLDINSISINFVTEQSAVSSTGTPVEIEMLNVSMAMNAYFQKPAEVAAAPVVKKKPSF